MSETKTIKNPSPLVLAVLALDEHFSELSRLGSRIDETDLKSNFDFEQSERLITRFAEAGQAVSVDIAGFVAALNEARKEAEAVAQKVTVKAELLKARKDEVQEKMVQFQNLSGKVSQLNESLMAFKRDEGSVLTDADRTQLANRLAEVEFQIQSLIDEASALKEVGQNARIKVLEQNADSMRQALLAVSLKLSAVRPSTLVN